MESNQGLNVLFIVAMGVAVTACGGSSGSSSSTAGDPPSDNGADGGAGSGDGGDGGGGGTAEPGDGSDDGVSSRACFNDTLLQTGTVYSQTLRVTDATAQATEITLDSMVSGAAVFPPTGQTGTETIIESTVETDQGSVTQQGRSYVDADLGADVVRDLGNITEASVDTGMGVVDSTTTVVFEPFSLDRLNLAPGESYVNEFTTRVTTEFEGLPDFGDAEDLPGFDAGDLPGSAGDTTIETTRTVTYEGRETVTVPAGTFETCRLTFEEVSRVEGLSEVEATSSVWLGVGFGLLVREIDDEDGDATETVLLSGSINGQPITQ